LDGGNGLAGCRVDDLYKKIACKRMNDLQNRRLALQATKERKKKG
jgi:hypothetical protein